MIPTVGSREHGQIVVCGLAGLLENALEVGGGAQAACSGEAVARRLQTSDGKPFAAFGAARIQNRTSAAGLHARAKTVGTDAFYLAGLIGSFHGVPVEFRKANTKLHMLIYGKCSVNAVDKSPLEV